MYKMSLKHLTLKCVSSRELSNLFVEQAVLYIVAIAHAIFSDKSKKDMLCNLLLQDNKVGQSFIPYMVAKVAHSLPIITFKLQSQDTITGFLLAGVGDVTYGRRQTTSLLIQIFNPMLEDWSSGL
ncbi:uncharacterized protein LOC122063363 [Macadamia integrifolia]|uniref:uncharacterized protein LOC122063363 n=1 Tax=Macadamia integrifolia TaxID=60698 RepID=UPI001C4F6758|nr:uncharacterized protein LOC122063363 [Macadamia integrifolia]